MWLTSAESASLIKRLACLPLQVRACKHIDTGITSHDLSDDTLTVTSSGTVWRFLSCHVEIFRQLKAIDFNRIASEAVITAVGSTQAAARSCWKHVTGQRLNSQPRASVRPQGQWSDPVVRLVRRSVRMTNWFGVCMRLLFACVQVQCCLLLELQ